MILYGAAIYFECTEMWVLISAYRYYYPLPPPLDENILCTALEDRGPLQLPISSVGEVWMFLGMTNYTLMQDISIILS
jgi:hypothetical protein